MAYSSKQYSGPITPKQASEMSIAVVNNANSLVNDADLLLENSSFSRVAALAILAIEELGKIGLIRHILMADAGSDLKKRWKDYRTHTQKNYLWVLPMLLKKTTKPYEIYEALTKIDPRMNKNLDCYKQLCFYTDMYDEGVLSSPSEISADIARSLLLVAKNLLDPMMASQNKGLLSEKFMGIMVKHMKPAKGASLAEVKKAELNWFAEADELGLIDKGRYKTIEEYLGHGS